MDRRGSKRDRQDRGYWDERSRYYRRREDRPRESSKTEHIPSSASYTRRHKQVSAGKRRHSTEPYSLPHKKRVRVDSSRHQEREDSLLVDEQTLESGRSSSSGVRSFAGSEYQHHKQQQQHKQKQEQVRERGSTRAREKDDYLKGNREAINQY